MGKAKLVVTGDEVVDDPVEFAKFYRELTGREPTPEEMAEAFPEEAGNAGS